MSPGEFALILTGGVAAGIINTLAGGGGLLALPILLFLGLPATVANGTYRLAIVLQNVLAVTAFERQGVRTVRPAAPLLLPSFAGAIVGAGAALLVDEALFRKLLAGVVVLALIPVFARRPAGGDAPLPRTRGAFLFAFALGVYGGFLQVGVGFLYLAVFSGFYALDLVRANALKVFLVLGYSVVALALFVAGGRFVWLPAVVLAIGTAAGGWMGAHLAVRRGDRFLRWVIAAAALATVGKLLGLFDRLLG